jgi:hypothetical protein
LKINIFRYVHVYNNLRLQINAIMNSNT